jgi:hypothetical protein
MNALETSGLDVSSNIISFIYNALQLHPLPSNATLPKNRKGRPEIQMRTRNNLHLQTEMQHEVQSGFKLLTPSPHG